MKSESSRLSVVSLGVAIGLTWALSMFLMGLASWHFGWATPIVTMMGSMYIGFKPTLIGSFIGLAAGFVDGFIAGVLIAFFYNLCRCCGCKKES